MTWPRGSKVYLSSSIVLLQVGLINLASAVHGGSSGFFNECMSGKGLFYKLSSVFGQATWPEERCVYEYIYHFKV